MSPLRLSGSTSGFSQLDAPAIAGDQTFTLPSTGGTIDRLNRAGNVLQVVNASTSTNTVNNTNVYADTTLTASITPTSASSKILVLVNQAGLYKTGSLDSGVRLQLLRDSTSLIEFAIGAGYTGTTTDNIPNAATTSYLDSPNTTSSVTYKTQFRNGVNAGGVRVQANSAFSTITLMEVAA
jgi:hypothetical protein